MSLLLDSERVLGFSIRECGERGLVHWPTERQDLYLLRLDVEQPLSVDPRVWPLAPATADAWHIAFTVANDPETSDFHPDWDFPVDWPDGRREFLGYDVADGGAISGLMNCGYGVEVAELRERWARHLNRHHLFNDRERALNFRWMTSERVPEHAPFFVYGLYRLLPPRLTRSA